MDLSIVINPSSGNYLCLLGKAADLSVLNIINFLLHFNMGTGHLSMHSAIVVTTSIK